jgi:4-amino-4-deoxy-L-arabinose transferase-like glycosyltransferase
VSFAAACFFAVYQGHQEAVMWYAALPELLVFFFCLAALLLWMRWVRDGHPSYYGAAVACFVLALLSKESAVAVVPLLALVAGRDWKWSLPRLFPFQALSIFYAAAIYSARDGHYHLHDGTFSLQAPFWIVLPVSLGRLLWICGALALAALAVWRAREHAALVRAAAVWMPVTLLPYCFLTYMPRVPSRHTYFASAGLALLVGAAFVTLRERVPARSRIAGVVAAVIVISECGYIWTRKQRQLLERAAPTERLLRMAHGAEVVRIRCFPYAPAIAESALRVNALDGVRLQFEGDRRNPDPAAVDLCTD